jgi:hypothetical protein
MAVINIIATSLTHWHSDTDLCLVVKVRERLAVSKQTVHRVHMERFNLRVLNGVVVKEQYCVGISDRFTALENLRH